VLQILLIGNRSFETLLTHKYHPVYLIRLFTSEANILGVRKVMAAFKFTKLYTSGMQRFVNAYAKHTDVLFLHRYL
jgi:hypothetical protein